VWTLSDGYTADAHRLAAMLDGRGIPADRIPV
jgi:hypothetical protein